MKNLNFYQVAILKTALGVLIGKPVVRNVIKVAKGSADYKELAKMNSVGIVTCTLNGEEAVFHVTTEGAKLVGMGDAARAKRNCEYWSHRAKAQVNFLVLKREASRWFIGAQFGKQFIPLRGKINTDSEFTGVSFAGSDIPYSFASMTKAEDMRISVFMEMGPAIHHALSLVIPPEAQAEGVDDVAKKIGEALRLDRERRGATLQTEARRLCLTPNWIKRMESGEVAPAAKGLRMPDLMLAEYQEV